MISVETKVKFYVHKHSQLSDEAHELTDWLSKNIGEHNEAWNVQCHNNKVWVIVWREADAPLVALRWS